MNELERRAAEICTDVIEDLAKLGVEVTMFHEQLDITRFLIFVRVDEDDLRTYRSYVSLVEFLYGLMRGIILINTRIINTLQTTISSLKGVS